MSSVDNETFGAVTHKGDKHLRRPEWTQPYVSQCW